MRLLLCPTLTYRVSRVRGVVGAGRTGGPLPRLSLSLTPSFSSNPNPFSCQARDELEAARLKREADRLREEQEQVSGGAA